MRATKTIITATTPVPSARGGSEKSKSRKDDDTFRDRSSGDPQLYVAGTKRKSPRGLGEMHGDANKSLLAHGYGHGYGYHWYHGRNFKTLVVRLLWS